MTTDEVKEYLYRKTYIHNCEICGCDVDIRLNRFWVVWEVVDEVSVELGRYICESCVGNAPDDDNVFCAEMSERIKVIGETK